MFYRPVVMASTNQNKRQFSLSCQFSLPAQRLMTFKILSASLGYFFPVIHFLGNNEENFPRNNSCVIFITDNLSPHHSHAWEKWFLTVHTALPAGDTRHCGRNDPAFLSLTLSMAALSNEGMNIGTCSRLLPERSA